TTILMRSAGPPDHKIIPALHSLLSDTNSSIRFEVAECMEMIGPAAQEAVPALKKLLNDQDELVRFHSAKAIWKISHETNICVAAFEQLLSTAQIDGKHHMTIQALRHHAATRLN